MVLYSTVWYCIVLYGNVRYCIVLYGNVWYCMEQCGIIWYIMKCMKHNCMMWYQMAFLFAIYSDK